eukprot:gnl/TRDRNA2_/TRDRNA2_94966_c0_seq2.p1 gnl/TRDRNA2_/TRDRNA2_94966_c0~~gnl/TRDRNA2_/TRDRNA2_94966_c0_seq2.p1  ORF type:complete len:296 (+),score=40.66 gnl/TRDRNA2_/TRDRNA2_94966_c0_seq2:137-1024(+)
MRSTIVLILPTCIVSILGNGLVEKHTGTLLIGRTRKAHRFQHADLHNTMLGKRQAEVDRSHTEVHKLDSLKPSLSYRGWRIDAVQAEMLHRLGDDVEVKRKLEQMRRKQRMHTSDRSHPELKALDALNLSYPDWQKDVAEAECHHREARNREFNIVSDFVLRPLAVKLNIIPLIGILGDVKTFDEHLEEMRKKQKMHVGDRSHPELRALDALKPKLSYPGWQKDAADVESYHIEDLPFLAAPSPIWVPAPLRWQPNAVADKLDEMRHKQSIHAGSHPEPHMMKKSILERSLDMLS